MTQAAQAPLVTMSLTEATLAALIRLRAEGETLDAVVARLAGRDAPESENDPASAATSVAAEMPAPSKREGPARHAYTIRFLGEDVQGATLGSVLAALVDHVAEIDASVLERLAGMKARTRRYVARDPSDLHGGRSDLPVIETASGWWVSANIGTDDLDRNLRALCKAAGLVHGEDVHRLP
jgi:hypothetical protein